MSFGKTLAQTRKKLNRMISWLALLLFIELLGLPYLVQLFFDVPPAVGGGATILVMSVTFLIAFRLGNRITNPLLEAGGDLAEQALAEDNKGS